MALRRDGIIDARLESLTIQSNRPIEDHLADFEAMMIARQRSEDHVKRSVAFVREVCTAAEFERPGDITADGMNRIMATMKADGKAPRTIQGRVVAAKAFTKWLVDHSKLAHDPLRSVKRPSLKTDRRLRRAQCSCRRNGSYASRGDAGERAARWDEPAGRRVALYAVGNSNRFTVRRSCGLSRSPICSWPAKSLTSAAEGRIRRTSKRPGSTFKRTWPKNYVQIKRRRKLPSQNVFTMPDEWSMADMLRGDLAEARKAWLDEVKHDPEARAKREESNDFPTVRQSPRRNARLSLPALIPAALGWLCKASSRTLSRPSCGIPRSR